jgi:hypothetical protein
LGWLRRFKLNSCRISFHMDLIWNAFSDSLYPLNQNSEAVLHSSVLSRASKVRAQNHVQIQTGRAAPIGSNASHALPVLALKNANACWRPDVIDVRIPSTTTNSVQTHKHLTDFSSSKRTAGILHSTSPSLRELQVFVYVFQTQNMFGSTLYV